MSTIIARAERRARLREQHARLRLECETIAVLIERRLPRDYKAYNTAQLNDLAMELRELKIRYLRRIMEAPPAPINVLADLDRQTRWAEAGIPLRPCRPVEAS